MVVFVVVRIRIDGKNKRYIKSLYMFKFYFELFVFFDLKKKE